LDEVGRYAYKSVLALDDVANEQLEGPLVPRTLHLRQALQRSFGVELRLGLALLQHSALVDDLQQLEYHLGRLLLEEEQGEELLVVSQQVHDEGELALVQVLGNYSLPHALLRVGHVEHVVDDLEGDAHVVHALGQLPHRRCLNPHHRAHHLHQHPQQAAGLQRGELDVVFRRGQVGLAAGFVALDVEALPDVAERHLAEVYLVDAALQLEGGERGDQFLHGQEVHEIGRVDGRVDPEDRVSARFSPALDGVVLDVVDDEAGAVQVLDEPADPHGLLPELVVEELVDEQGGDDAHVLAAQLPQVGVGLQDLCFLDGEELFDEVPVLQVDRVLALEHLLDGHFLASALLGVDRRVNGCLLVHWMNYQR